MRSIVLVLMAAGLLFVSSPVSGTVLPVSTTAHAEPDPAKVKAAMEEFRSLSRKEKRMKLKEVRKEIRQYKEARKAGREADTDTLLLVILAILLPPLAVYLYEGEINNRFWISVILTLLAWVPGIVYALVLILGNH